MSSGEGRAVQRKKSAEWVKGQPAAGAGAEAADSSGSGAARDARANDAAPGNDYETPEVSAAPTDAPPVAPRTEPPLTLKERQLERERRLAAAAAAAATSGSANGQPLPSALSRSNSLGGPAGGPNGPGGYGSLGASAQQANGRSRRLRQPDAAERDGDGHAHSGGLWSSCQLTTGLNYQQEALLAPLRELLQLGHLSAGVDPRFKTLGTLANGGVSIRESKTLELFGTKLGRGLFAGRDFAKDEPVRSR